MQATQRSGLWGFIVLLAALAFLRSLAPERTARAVRNIMNYDQEQKDIQQLRDEMRRERTQLEKLKRDVMERTKNLDAESQKMKDARDSSDSGNDGLSLNDPDLFTKGKEENLEDSSDNSNETNENSNAPSVETNVETDDSSSNSSIETDSTETIELADDECRTIIAPKSSKSGIGTQVMHIWSSISVTFAIRNACLVIPPILADDGHDNYRAIPFSQVFDLDELRATGVKLVPLSACEQNGVSSIFDDAGAESAVVKNYASFIKQTHPTLSKSVVLITPNTKGYRFETHDVVKENVHIVAEHIAKNRPSDTLRHCVGFGRMRAQVAINPDVLEHFRPAMDIDHYVTAKYPHANSIMFVKLRWNRVHCSKTRTEEGTVCIHTNKIIPVEDYVRAIAHRAHKEGASAIYLSTPIHMPEDVSEYFATYLDVLDPILLDVDGDSFTANVIERELAARAKVFIEDGGIWGQTIQLTRKSRIPQSDVEHDNSLAMVASWKDSGSPADSAFLLWPEISDDGVASNDVGQNTARSESVDAGRNEAEADENGKDGIDGANSDAERGESDIAQSADSTAGAAENQGDESTSLHVDKQIGGQDGEYTDTASSQTTKTTNDDSSDGDAAGDTTEATGDTTGVQSVQADTQGAGSKGIFVPLELQPGEAPPSDAIPISAVGSDVVRLSEPAAA